MTIAAYWAAVEARSRDKITLRQGARVRAALDRLYPRDKMTKI
jgi:hypothetical protein